ncbi:unnamed protein product [Amoebophrya sp. A25]|nr:unnamed protein product [Amoebophrya sp. A25]|eukprot:GSA25T00027393001.1
MPQHPASRMQPQQLHQAAVHPITQPSSLGVIKWLPHCGACSHLLHCHNCSTTPTKGQGKGSHV